MPSGSIVPASDIMVLASVLLRRLRRRSEQAFARHCCLPATALACTAVQHMVTRRPKVERRTNRAVSDRELSRLVADYYRDDAKERGIANEYDERLRRVQPELEELSRRGIESAFVLHVLICTSLGRLTPNWQTWPSQPLAAPGRRRAMLRAVRTLKNLGQDALAGAFGDTQEDRGVRFYTDLAILEQMLSGGTYRSPAFQIGGPQSPRTRQREVYRRACLACLMTALNGQPKRAAEVVLLLKRFDLLPAGTGRRSEWVKR